jgi:MFS family permease
MKTINKNIVVLGFVSFFTDMASAMINPILPIFIVVTLHEGVDKLGVVVALATFVSYALRLLSGYLSDRYGVVKPLVVVGYFLSAISKPFIGFTHDYKSIAALKSFERFGKGIRSAPKDVMISTYSQKNTSGKTFGFHKMLDIAGELSGILILFGTLYYFGESESVIRNIFYATLITGIIGVILVLFFVEDIPKREKHPQTTFTLTKKDKQSAKSLLFYFFFLFFLFSDAFFTIQAKEVGITTLFIPLLFAVSAAIQTVTSYGFGLFIDKYGVKAVLSFAYVCGVIAQALLYMQNPLFTWIAFGFFGLFTVASLNANRAYIAQSADNQGSVYGVFYAGIALFGAFGAYISGLIWQQYGLSNALMFSLIGTLFVSLLFIGSNYVRIRS